MRWINLGAAAAISLSAAACATGGAGPEVASVVQDEQARQAAAGAAEAGSGARDALKAGHPASSTAAAEEPPFR